MGIGGTAVLLVLSLVTDRLRPSGPGVALDRSLADLDGDSRVTIGDAVIALRLAIGL